MLYYFVFIQDQVYKRGQSTELLSIISFRMKWEIKIVYSKSIAQNLKFLHSIMRIFPPAVVEHF